MKPNNKNPWLLQEQPEQQQQNGPAAPPAPPVATPAQQKISSYEPPPLDVAALLDGKVAEPAPAPAPAPAPKPVETPPPVEHKPVPATTEDDGFDFLPTDAAPPVAKPAEVVPPTQEPTVEQKAEANRDLRSQLAEAQKRLKELESGSDREEYTKRLAEAEERSQRLQGALHQRDPLTHPDIVALRSEMATEYGRVGRQMAIIGEDPAFLPEFLQRTLPELIQAGDQNGKPYLEKVRDLGKELGEKGLSRESINSILGLVDKGVDNSYRQAGKIKDLNDNWQTYQAKEAMEQHTRIAKDWADVKKGWLTPSPDQIENDPYNPVVFMHKAMTDKPELEKALKQTADTLVRTFMPLPPIMPEQLEGMEDNEIANYMEDRQKKHEQRMQGFRGVVGNAMAFYRMGPGILRRLKEMEDALADYKGGNPTPAGELGGPSSQPAGETKSIKNYEPGPLPSI